MITNVIAGMGIIILLGFVIYGIYMAIWGVMDEYN